MEEFENVRKLISLKKHEMPPSEFVDDFLASFREKQRVELMKRSVWSLARERVEMFFDDLFVPKWAVAMGLVAIAALMAWVAMPDRSGSATAAVDNSGAVPVSNGEQDSFVVRPHKGEPFEINGVRIMIEVENHLDIQQQDLAEQMSKGQGADVVIIPTGGGMGIAVPADKYRSAYDQAFPK